MRSLRNSLLILTLSMALGSCASFSHKTSRQAFQTGTASWYGERFQGRPTASGERFNMHALTAAHRTLPFGQKVLVTSLTTGKSVSVRINDRGPFHGNRVIDVSYAAAVELDMVKKGEDRIQIHLLND